MTNQHPGRDPEHLRHALRCAARVEQLHTVEQATLLASADLVDAPCRNMYQLADVTGKISDAVKARHPGVPWRAIAGLRNVYAHAYEGIDLERLWADLERGDVTDLAAQLRLIYRELDPPPGEHDPR